MGFRNKIIKNKPIESYFYSQTLFIFTTVWLSMVYIGLINIGINQLLTHC